MRLEYRRLLTGALAVTSVTLSFFLLFWNRFAGLRSGCGTYCGGTAWLAGSLPYRDYFAPTTPLTAAKAAAILYLFGDAPVTLRGFAVFDRTILAFLVYLWLSRLFRPTIAAAAAIVTIIVSAGDASDPLSSYNHDTILAAIASGLVANFALNRIRSNGTLAMLGVCSGFLAGVCFGMKQTIGLGATVAIPAIVAVCLLRLEGIKKASIFLAAFALGWAALAGVLLLWLSHLGALKQFFEDVFKKGPAAKASHLSDFAIRYVRVAGEQAPAVILAVAALAFSLPALRRSSLKTGTGYEPTNRMAWIFVAGAISVGLGIYVSYTNFAQLLWFLSKFTIYLTFGACTLLILYYAGRLLLDRLSRREAQLLLLAGVSFVVAFMLSLSWPSFEAMVIPGLGLVTAAALDGSGMKGKRFIYAICAILIISETGRKLQRPFGFSDLAEPSIHAPATRSNLAELRGLVLPVDVVRFVDGTARIVKEKATSPNDTIFTYPELGLFYFVTKKRAPTLSYSHNIDVASDDFARSEAARLLVGRPAVLIYYREPEEFLRADELAWRNGKRSGQRDLIAAVETLAKEYSLEATFDLAPDNTRMYVYVRP